MRAMAAQITSLTIIFWTVYSGADQRKHQSSASLAFVQGIHRSAHKGPVTRNMFPFDDVIIWYLLAICISYEHLNGTYINYICYFSSYIIEPAVFGVYHRVIVSWSQLRVTGLCAGNSPVTGDFPAQRASNTEIVFMWWRPHMVPPCKMSHMWKPF